MSLFVTLGGVQTWDLFILCPKAVFCHWCHLSNKKNPLFKKNRYGHKPIHVQQKNDISNTLELLECNKG